MSGPSGPGQETERRGPDGPPCFVIVHNISKKHNVGTLARCAAAFRVKEVWNGGVPLDAPLVAASGLTPVRSAPLHGQNQSRRRMVDLSTGRRFVLFAVVCAATRFSRRSGAACIEPLTSEFLLREVE
eukprot:evm.model.scf_1028.2 EVM.evm.TU.scf_1028.2   scf_1028:10410-10793(+)